MGVGLLTVQPDDQPHINPISMMRLHTYQGMFGLSPHEVQLHICSSLNSRRAVGATATRE